MKNMSTIMYSTILQILFFIPFSLQLDYLCRPNGTFVITNPDNIKYTLVHVQDDLNTCSTTTFSEDYTSLQIDGCQMDHYVRVMFISRITTLTRATQSLILTRDNYVAYRIMCRDLPPGGIEISVSTSMGVRNHVDEVGQENAEITRVFSNVEDPDPLPPITVSLNDKFEWVIQVPDDQQVLPLTCTAYAGRILTATSNQLTLMENGCPAQDVVTSSFVHAASSGDTNSNRYVIMFNAFRFNDSPFITVVCSMRVCSETTNQTCTVNCNRKRRRRRMLRRVSRDATPVTDMTVILNVLDKKPETEADLQSRDPGNDAMDRILFDFFSGAKGASFSIQLVLLLATVAIGLS